MEELKKINAGEGFPFHNYSSHFMMLSLFIQSVMFACLFNRLSCYIKTSLTRIHQGHLDFNFSFFKVCYILKSFEKSYAMHQKQDNKGPPIVILSLLTQSKIKTTYQNNLFFLKKGALIASVDKIFAELLRPLSSISEQLSLCKRVRGNSCSETSVCGLSSKQTTDSEPKSL